MRRHSAGYTRVTRGEGPTRCGDARLALGESPPFEGSDLALEEARRCWPRHHRHSPALRLAETQLLASGKTRDALAQYDALIAAAPSSYVGYYGRASFIARWDSRGGRGAVQSARIARRALLTCSNNWSRSCSKEGPIRRWPSWVVQSRRLDRSARSTTCWAGPMGDGRPASGRDRIPAGNRTDKGFSLLTKHSANSTAVAATPRKCSPTTGP
jgi:hypothetical protein